MPVSLTVTAFAGDTVQHVAEEMGRVADQLGVYVECPFNGVTLMTRPGGDPSALVENYFKVLRSSAPIKIAVGWPSRKGT